MDEILKGNYVVPDLDKKVGTPEDNSDSLTEEFQAAALKKLGGSITFVKKKGSFLWKGDKKEVEKKDE